MQNNQFELITIQGKTSKLFAARENADEHF